MSPPDYARMRATYFAERPEGPMNVPCAPEGPPERIPTESDMLAWYEQWRVAMCLRLGGDPQAEGLGEHGRLIGGPDKPMTILPWDATRCVRLTPMPLTWYEHDAAREHMPTTEERRNRSLGHMLAKHMAGVAGRPSAEEMTRMLTSTTVTPWERSMLMHLLGTIDIVEARWLMTECGFSVREIVQATHNAGVRRNDLIRYLNQFARRPVV